MPLMVQWRIPRRNYVDNLISCFTALLKKIYSVALLVTIPDESPHHLNQDPFHRPFVRALKFSKFKLGMLTGMHSTEVHPPRVGVEWRSGPILHA